MSFKDLENAVLGTCNIVMGEVATYTPKVGSPVSITGVFENAWVEVKEVTSLRPIFRVRLLDLVFPPSKGDAITISSVDYLVMEPRADGYGGSSLILQKV